MEASEDGRFWISPACRQDVEKCIPVVAAGDGWLVSDSRRLCFIYDIYIYIYIYIYRTLYKRL